MFSEFLWKYFLVFPRFDFTAAGLQWNQRGFRDVRLCNRDQRCEDFLHVVWISTYIISCEQAKVSSAVSPVADQLNKLEPKSDNGCKRDYRHDWVCDAQ